MKGLVVDSCAWGIHLRVEELAFLLATTHQSGQHDAARVNILLDFAADTTIVARLEQRLDTAQRATAQVVHKVDQCVELVLVELDAHGIHAVDEARRILVQERLTLRLRQAAARTITVATDDQVAISNSGMTSGIQVIARFPSFEAFNQVETGLIELMRTSTAATATAAAAVVAATAAARIGQNLTHRDDIGVGNVVDRGQRLPRDTDFVAMPESESPDCTV